MDIHRQTCQSCGSKNMVNLLVRKEGENDHVFVQCRDCKELVARYIIGPHGYYHHGKGFESYLKGLNRGGYFESGTDLQLQFEKVKEACMAEFDEVLNQLKEMGKEIE